MDKKAWIRIQIQRIYIRNIGEKTKPYPALLIQEVEDAQLGLDEVNAGLVVVEVDHLPLDPLLQHRQHVNNEDIRIRIKKGLETFSQVQNSTFLHDLETSVSDPDSTESKDPDTDPGRSKPAP